MYVPNNASPGKFVKATYHNVLQLGELLTSSLAKSAIENTVLKEAMTGQFEKIDTSESFMKTNQDISSRVGYKLLLKKTFKQNVSLNKGIEKSVKDCIRASIEPEFITKLGWSGANGAIKFEGTSFCTLLKSNFDQFLIIT